MSLVLRGVLICEFCDVNANVLVQHMTGVPEPRVVGNGPADQLPPGWTCDATLPPGGDCYRKHYCPACSLKRAVTA